MRVLFGVLAFLGMLVMLLSILDHSLQVSMWSAVVADASRAGALQDPALAKRLEQLPPGNFSSALTVAGAAIMLLALWGFTKAGRRPK